MKQVERGFPDPAVLGSDIESTSSSSQEGLHPAEVDSQQQRAVEVYKYTTYIAIGTKMK